MTSRASLVVVGSGIKFLSHLTTEAKAYITQSDKVLYLVNDPAMKEWIMRASQDSESLDEIYSQYHLRQDCYQAITDYILSCVRGDKHVCVVLYGHPALFSQPGLIAAKIAKQEGYYSKVLPGISAEDCLIADLMLDTNISGCQSFEATDFLLNERVFDIHSHLMLWQVDVIGILDHGSNLPNINGINILQSRLLEFYPSNHTLIIYEAAIYPGLEPSIDTITLAELPIAKVSPISTIYVEPIPRKGYSKSTATSLNIKIKNLEGR